MNHEVKNVGPIEPLEQTSFAISESSCWHTARGGHLGRGPSTQGRYHGYIAALVINDRIVEIKAVPGSYEREIDKAKEFLSIGRAPFVPGNRRFAR